MPKRVSLLFSLVGLFSLAGLSVIPPVLAEDDSCFIVLPSGASLNLSHLCGVKPPITPPAQNTIQAPPPELPKFFQARIKRRMAGIPVIDVTFNGGQTFEMLVDTGASKTMITREMASRLQTTPNGRVLVSTASATNVEFSTADVASVQVSGAIVNDVNVIIGGPEQDIGLLGQDFFGEYDLVIRRNVIEFHRS